MLRKFSLISLICVGLLAAGCASKKKEEAGAEPTGDANIEHKDMAFDPLGSDSGKINGLNTIYFEYDKATLTTESRKTLAANADWIKSNDKVVVQIEGHTDERGSVEYNLALGERRAKSVKDYLVSLGIDAKKLTVISYGEEKPLMQGSSEDAWGKNRRANFVPMKQ